MTNAIINGLKQNGLEIVFFAICQVQSEAKAIMNSYKNIVDKIIVLPSAFGIGVPKYKMLTKLLYHTAIDTFYRKEYRKVILELEMKPDIIIAHSPSMESVFYGTIMKQYYSTASYYQYWSDPIALSGITPDALNIKRVPFRFIESSAMERADKIIFGTKTLMMFQKQLYPKLARKMTYIDIPYVEKKIDIQEIIPYSILYAGNYHKNIRNIEPLIDAVEQMEGYRLDIYGDGEIKDRPLHNTHVHGRISSEELSGIEGKYEYLVCVLNHSCIQIPGKIFYDMGRRVKIIVIADGNYQKTICDYLKSYGRFVVCKNDRSDIINSINSISDKEIDYEIIKSRYSPKKVCKDLLDGGLK